MSDGGVALTFDDGPHPEGTPAVLDMLDEAGIKATFFLVGEQVERRPALAAEIAGRGHLVALHGYRHRPQPLMGVAAVEDDLARGAAAIESATGAGSPAPPALRPLQPRRAGRRAATTGWQPLLWSSWGKDWRRLTTPQRIAARATARSYGPGT